MCDSPELKRCLYGLFSQYGQILDIVALKTPRMRGQAFIVYKELHSAVAAMRSLQGYPFLGKSLVPTSPHPPAYPNT